MSAVDDNKALVRQFMDVFSSGNTPAILGMMDEDATWWVAGTMPISGTYTRTEFGTLLDRVSAECTGPITLTPKFFTAEGNRVAVETESLTHTRNGRTYNNHYHFLFEVRDGKVFRIREYLDTMHANAVLCTP